MTLLDASNFNRRTYTFDYVRREFLGDVRCLVFDVAPIDKTIAGQFMGSIWVEDKDDRIVRFNGTFTAGKTPSSHFGLHFSNVQLYFHFDSWRLNVAPGQWVPAFVYVEESGGGAANTRQSRFKSQTRLWDFNSSSGNRQVTGSEEPASIGKPKRFESATISAALRKLYERCLSL